MNIFTCPVCSEMLCKEGKSYICTNRHTFDIAKSGYVNLLISKQLGKSVHGDNKLMVKARRDFLAKGYYGNLLSALSEAVCEYSENGSVILDSGCGEGYYTKGVSDYLNDNNINAEFFGVDISKTALEYAAKLFKEANFAVGSVFHLPIADKSCDVVMTLFAPFCREEFIRVLKDSGIFIMVIPSEKHLWGLKKAVYDTPYLNEVKEYSVEGFKLIENKKIAYEIVLENNEDIQNLFSMTPYYYRTGKIQQERLAALDKLQTEIEFEILIYMKN